MFNNDFFKLNIRKFYVSKKKNYEAKIMCRGVFFQIFLVKKC
jgi:hypothetical protein